MFIDLCHRDLLENPLSSERNSPVLFVLLFGCLENRLNWHVMFTVLLCLVFCS